MTLLRTPMTLFGIVEEQMHFLDSPLPGHPSFKPQSNVRRATSSHVNHLTATAHTHDLLVRRRQHVATTTVPRILEQDLLVDRLVDRHIHIVTSTRMTDEDD